MHCNAFGAAVEMLRDSSLSSRGSHRSSSGGFKPPLGEISTELCLSSFKRFLKHTLYQEEAISEPREALRPMEHCLDLENFFDVLDELEIRLLSLLKSYPSLSSPVVGDIHSYLGLIYLEQENDTAAVDSFTKAIWFLKRSSSNTPDDSNAALAVAKANHRLGLAYGRCGDHKQAIHLIEHAIATYSSLCETSCEDYIRAKEDCHAVQEALQLELLTKNSNYKIRPDMEETVSEHRRMPRRRRTNRTTSGNTCSSLGSNHSRRSVSPLGGMFGSGGSSHSPSLRRSASVSLKRTLSPIKVALKRSLSIEGDSLRLPRALSSKAPPPTAVA